MANPSLPPLPLPESITSYYLTHPSSDLRYHYLSAGDPQNPLVLFLHGFPEFSFSWRHILPKVAEAGYHAVAPDMRGSGRTTGWDTRSFNTTDISSFSMTRMVRDTTVLVSALGHKEVHCLVGHDAGARIASLCALGRPDLYKRIVLLTHPYSGSPLLGPGTIEEASSSERHARVIRKKPDMNSALAALSVPMKDYKHYYASNEAAKDLDPHEGMKEFLRDYFYLKSASWPGNKPHPLKSKTAEELAKIPYYYTMPYGWGMRRACKEAKVDSEPDEEKRSKTWLPDVDLDVYVAEWKRIGFQGALNWYRINDDPLLQCDLDIWAGMKLKQPCLMITGEKDWGTYKEPGAIEKMPSACKDFRGVVEIKGAGHFITQEQPERLAEAILNFSTDDKEDIEKGKKRSRGF